MKKWQSRDLNPDLPDAITAPGSFPGNGGRLMEERYSEHTEGEERKRQVKSDCLRVSKESGRQMGLEGASCAGPFCSERTFCLDTLSMKKEKRKNIRKEKHPSSQEVGSVLPAGTTSLAGAQPLLRNRKQLWTDQASSEPIPLTLFSKNYQSWFKSHSLLSS